MLCDWNLTNMYQVAFNLWKIHGMPFEEYYSMIPWERDVFITQLENWVEMENQKNRNR